MSKRIILAFSHFDTGGLQTLMIRISRWCKISGIEPLIICETSDNYMSSLCDDYGINVLKTYKQNGIIRYIKSNYSDKDEIRIITFELPEFLLFEHIISKNFKRWNIQHYIYNVSVSGMIFGRQFSGIAGKVIYKFYQKIADAYYQNKQVLFMDNETKLAALSYYSISNIEGYSDVLLLPMFISEEPNYLDIRQDNILTVSRADFPYKGYLIGLIRDFEKLASENKNLRLNIVSFGKDIVQLKNTIEKCKYKNRIILYEGLPDQEIKRLLANTRLYIGMGTTVLDAANEGVPSIVVFHSTMENIASGYFHDNPYIVGKFGSGKPAYDLLKDFFLLRQSEYIEIRKKTYDEFRKIYSIDTFMHTFLNITSEKRLFLSNGNWMIHKFLFIIRSFRRKVLHLR